MIAIAALYLVIGLAWVVVCWAYGEVDMCDGGLWLLILLLWPIPLFLWLFGAAEVLVKYAKDKFK